jgi:ubiquinone/menaquinone biosynthesis C-methylase UbiE
MAQAQSDAKKGWDKVYSEGFMTMWYPNEDIIRFCSRLIRKRLTHEEYEVKRPVERVLDLGCGNGRHAMYFARQGLKTAGIDVSEKAIEWAGEWARREGLEIDFRVGNIEHLPYEDQSFDAVVSHGVLDHVPMMAARTAAEEVRRVLRPGGLFYCDLRSTEDFEFGIGEEAGPNTFVVVEGYEKGLVQHFFSANETEALFDGLFRILYSEITENRLGPDFQRKYSRWVFATESL